MIVGESPNQLTSSYMTTCGETAIRSLHDKPHLYLTGARPQLGWTYIGRMSSSADTPEKPRQVGILSLEEDAQSAAAVRQLLDSEGWRVSVAADPDSLLSELR